ncbi:putative type I restriction-modification enzyme R subunit [Klebsiella pneumoniae]|uniref:Putative type I restriction-modification enzyme R subunit n=1 Tax=Klebsiella pneumoniae TaxID=573 RepID=A0A377VB58_KLEPN|nr:putative type I restriction-modification enzyme R subunit [Klebsiella pneumoniae]
MLLTGFDSKYLNTLYVDKNLKHHGLIQAFSRTNRVLNDSKPYGNILDSVSSKSRSKRRLHCSPGRKSTTLVKSGW